MKGICQKSTKESVGVVTDEKVTDKVAPLGEGHVIEADTMQGLAAQGFHRGSIERILVAISDTLGKVENPVKNALQER